MLGQHKSIVRGSRKIFQERAYIRHEVAIAGKILSPDLSSCVECVVQDVSEGGALVTLDAETGLPDRVYLWQAETGASIPCDVRWQKMKRAGLRFADPNAPAVRALTRICLPPSSRIEPMRLRLPHGAGAGFASVLSSR